MSRPSLDDTMMDIAGILAQRATCQKLKVGAVITDIDGRIIGSGYNGVPKGMRHCTDFACPGVGAPKGADLCEAVHAESNALLNCREIHHAYAIYTTHAPCMRCVKTLLNTPINQIIFFNGDATEDNALALWVSAGREWLQHS
jgi:dCMP deaminase